MLVLANGGPGGMQRQVVLLANGLSERGHDVVVVVGGSEAVDGLEVTRVSLIRASQYQGRIGGFAFVRDLRRLVRRYEPQVVHGHGLRLAIALRLAHRSGLEALVTSHGIDPAVLHNLRLPLRLARIRVLACGVAPQRLLQSIGISSSVLHVGIEPAPEPKAACELRERFSVPEGHAIGVAAIRLSEQKDPATMIGAVAQIERLHLVLFGDGPLLEASRMLATSLGVAERIHFAGYDSEVRAWMAAAQFVVLSSRWEGHVLVALEAMAAGVPLVATACPGIAEWTEHEATALLSPVGDEQALAQSMRRVLDDAPLTQHLIVEGKAMAARHSVEKMVSEHFATYGVIA